MYRTPKPEEFVDGFVFEIYVNKVWLPCVYGSLLNFTKEFIKKGTERGKEFLRVRCECMSCSI